MAADDETLAFCPLQYTATKTDRSWAMEWIDTMLVLIEKSLHGQPAAIVIDEAWLWK